MIFDKIKNINKYPEIPTEIADFVKTLSSNIELGKKELDEKNYANVDEYFTKSPENCRLEAHKKYIDIQLLLEGQEELDYISTDNLIVNEDYDTNRDVMFFEPPKKRLNSVILTPGNFVLLYPHEAHMPQMNYGNTSTKVKKVVVKIQV